MASRNVVQVDPFTMTDSECDLLYKSQHPSYLNLSIHESFGSDSFLTGCPPSLSYLYSTNALYLKPYSGPLMTGNYSMRKRYEVLDGNGKRIFMICNARDQDRKWATMDDETVYVPHYRINLIVYNHVEDEVFQYYGTPGEYIKVGPNGKGIPWGEVTRSLRRTSRCSCSRTRRLHFNVVTEKSVVEVNENVGDKNNTRKSGLVVEKMYSIDGTMQLSCFPTDSSEKLYYGTFDCVMSSIPLNDDLDAIPVGQMSSSLENERLGMSLPGMRFPRELNVYHKAVLFGALLVDVTLK